ncbi:M23 family metallopeptidase [Cytobacillus sp.]|uniref:M23 family metallopeptidase n=1 Tax=Cytobacillus sp. TaxID=2675269 RepID=UPI0028BD781F|nr:M23 family metallopeptidase [Cytobacillus sp.]
MAISAEKQAALSEGHEYEKNKIKNGWYDNPDNRKMATTDELRNAYIYQKTGNFDHIGNYDPKYDDLMKYYNWTTDQRNNMSQSEREKAIQGKVNEEYAKPEVTYTGGGGSRNSFTPNQRNALTYGEAADRAKQQLDPLYERAVENVRKNRYQNELNASEVASARGLAHSGLAADQMNKIGIASQSNISDLDAQRSAKIAEMAQRMMEFDQNLALQERAQQLSEYLGVEGLNLNRDQFDWSKYANQRDFDYNRSRDLIGDQRYDQQFDYQRMLNDRNFNYQQQRDKRRDAEWESEQKDARAWRKYIFENMSASEKAQLEWAKAQYGEEAAWRDYEMRYKGNLEQSMNQAMIDYYNNANFNTEVKGDGWIPNLKDYKITSQPGTRTHPVTGQKNSNHRGMDIAVPKGTPVASTISGKVVSTSGHSSYGNTVVIQDANGYLHRYAHLDSIGVKVGQNVSRGSLVGKSGNTGRSTGPHLHYEVTNSKGAVLDPSPFLR